MLSKEVSNKVVDTCVCSKRSNMGFEVRCRQRMVALFLSPISKLFGHGELFRKNAEDEQKSTLFCS